jgi:hypothetical protein
MAATAAGLSHNHANGAKHERLHLIGLLPRPVLVAPQAVDVVGCLDQGISSAHAAVEAIANRAVDLVFDSFSHDSAPLGGQKAASHVPGVKTIIAMTYTLKRKVGMFLDD